MFIFYKTEHLPTEILGTAVHYFAEPMVGKEYVSQILTTIHEALPHSDKRVQMSQDEINNCVNFVSDVAILLFREVKVPLFKRGLLLSLGLAIYLRTIF